MPDYIWLSHELKKETPAYGGGRSLQITDEKKISTGDSCNSVTISLSGHLGTHVDAPYHFIESGKRVGDYTAQEWIFLKPALLTIQVKPDEIITQNALSQALAKINDPDILLIKTGFEQYRDQDIYWKHSPAFSDDIAYFLKENFPSISAIGFDSISLSGYQHRALGRKAHHAFLSKNIRIFEDMHLLNVTTKKAIQEIFAIPLRFENADGAPCAIVAKIEK